MTQTYNNNLSPLPFYTSLSEQNHRRSYAFGQIYPLYGSTTMLLPFQIMREHSDDTITTADLYYKDGTLCSSLLSALTIGGLTIVDHSTYSLDVIVFPSNVVMATGLECGQYYLVISDGTNTWYSDVMTLVDDMSPYLTIEWYDSENLYFDGGILDYENTGYRNRLYFANELGKPEYTFEEEGESRDGYYFAEKQISYKTYKANVLASEPVTDAMRLIRLSDIVKVRDKYGRVYQCDTFLITPTWQTQGDIASIEIEFTTQTVVKKIGWGYTPTDNGDFNDDYNTDYDNL